MSIDDCPPTHTHCGTLQGEGFGFSHFTLMCFGDDEDDGRRTVSLDLEGNAEFHGLQGAPGASHLEAVARAALEAARWLREHS